MRIRNWRKFQHYNKPNPSWLKLYRDLLDDVEYHSMNPLAAKYLPLLWLVCCSTDGELPPVEKLAFRLRLDVHTCQELIPAWAPYLEGEPRESLEEVYRESTPERERETEREKTSCPPQAAGEFVDFWKMYPKKVGKGAALKAWRRAKRPPTKELLASLSAQMVSEQWQRDGGQFIPHPATWLNQERWADELPTPSALAPQDQAGPSAKEKALARIMADPNLKREFEQYPERFHLD